MEIVLQENHQPTFHGGVTVKMNVNQRYATTGITGAILKTLADRAQVPLQVLAFWNGLLFVKPKVPLVFCRLCMAIMLSHYLWAHSALTSHVRTISNWANVLSEIRSSEWFAMRQYSGTDIGSEFGSADNRCRDSTIGHALCSRAGRYQLHLAECQALHGIITVFYNGLIR